MNDESKNSWTDPELEARIVALVLGEASDFERDELIRLIERRPELAAFKEQIQAVHAQMQDLGSGEWAIDDAWKLSAEKRNTVLAAFRGQAEQQRTEQVTNEQRKPRRAVLEKIVWNLTKIAAVLCIVGLSLVVFNAHMMDSARYQATSDATTHRATASRSRNYLGDLSTLRGGTQLLTNEETVARENVGFLSASRTSEQLFDHEKGPQSALEGLRRTLNSSAPASTEDVNGPELSGQQLRKNRLFFANDEADAKDGVHRYGGRLTTNPQPLARKEGSVELSLPTITTFSATPSAPAAAESAPPRAPASEPRGTVPFREAERFLQREGRHQILGEPLSSPSTAKDDRDAASKRVEWEAEDRGAAEFDFVDSPVREVEPRSQSGLTIDRFKNGGRDDRRAHSLTDDSVKGWDDQSNAGFGRAGTGMGGGLGGGANGVVPQVNEFRKGVAMEDQLGRAMQSGPRVRGDAADPVELAPSQPEDAGIDEPIDATEVPFADSKFFDTKQGVSSSSGLTNKPAATNEEFNSHLGRDWGLAVDKYKKESTQSIADQLSDNGATSQDAHFLYPDASSQRQKSKPLTAPTRGEPSTGQTNHSQPQRNALSSESRAAAADDSLGIKQRVMKSLKDLSTVGDQLQRMDNIEESRPVDVNRRLTRFESGRPQSGKEISPDEHVGSGSRLANRGQSYWRQFASVTLENKAMQEAPLRQTVAPAGLNEQSAEIEALSTFSLHVSDVSFKLAQAALARGEWPDPARVRIEEFVNAFDYGDPLPSQNEKVACALEQSVHPFLQQRNLLRISLRTAASGRSTSTPLRLTLLLDNSGSMERPDRQQTVRRAFALLVQQLKPIDQVTLISFARQPRLLADKVSGDQLDQLVQLVDSLPSEGGTNIEAALQLAFEKAKEQQVDAAQNRIILLTDGAVNLGNANPDSLAQMIATMRNAGIAFDAAGISAEGLNDEILEALTRKGDGRYYLLNAVDAADDGFVRQVAGALRPAAKNVKVQVEFNPSRVGRYKLLGFEKHRLNKEDFRNDNVDAAEMAAAEAGVAVYQLQAKPDGEGDIGSVSVRFRDLSTGQMIEKRWPIPYQARAPRPDQTTPSLRIATSAALLAAKLRGEPLGEVVDLKTLSDLMAGLPDEQRNVNRVQQLQQMIHQSRQMSGQ